MSCLKSDLSPGVKCQSISAGLCAVSTAGCDTETHTHTYSNLWILHLRQCLDQSEMLSCHKDGMNVHDCVVGCG